MKLIRTKNTQSKPQDDHKGPRHTWKLLVVDDEPDVRELTRLNLKGFRFADRDLEILEAGSAYEAKEILEKEKEIAVALIDVVMETDDAGLQLVEFIRQDLGNQMIRLVIRTGQPGLAPERYVIDHYDIDDYKDKTELTAQRLYTTVRSAIKSYRDLKTIDLNRQGLAKVLEAAPDIYRINNRSLDNFFEGVLTQVVGLCNLSETSFISTIEGMIATIDQEQTTVQATSGHIEDKARFEEIRSLCTEAVLSGDMPDGLRKEAFVIPLLVQAKPVGFIYVEPTQDLNETDRKLLSVVAQQCASALENLRLHFDLSESYDHMVNMLARTAEHKDETTGSHINRIDSYTQRVAKELGVSEAEAEFYGKASRLHDVGKVGVPDAILGKPGELNDEEFETIRAHTQIGGNILEGDKLLNIAKDIALHHHERWDGTGYPEGKPARQFHLATRIVSVVDVFDALISRRPYKEPWSTADALDEINRCAGTQFDPTVVSAFHKLYEEGVFEDLIQSAEEANRLAD